MDNKFDVNDDDDDEIPALQNLDEPIPIEDDGSDDEIPNLQNLDEHENSHLPPVPVTILTGFLGSGKTTLVRHILTSPEHQKRIAVIENEFGGGESDVRLAQRLGLSVNDASTLSVETMIAKDGTDGSNLADFIELPNGCVCCTVKDSLVETLEGLLAKRTDLDYVIIEASGMADPGPVASIFWLDDALESRIRLDGIVTCVDAKNIGFQLESTSSSSPAPKMGYYSTDHESLPNDEGGGGGDEAARQIAFADRIIINKIDLLEKNASDMHKTTTNIEEVLQEIKSINPTAPIKTTMYSKIQDLDWILDANCFDAERVKDVESAFQQSIDDDDSMRRSPLQLHAPLDGLCGLCNEPPPPLNYTVRKHQHTNAVGTIALFGRGSVDLHKINTWLASILWPDQDASDEVCRARLEESLSNKTNATSTSSEQGGKKQTIYRAKGILSVGHTMDNAGKIVSSINDWVDDGLTAGLVSQEDGLDKRRFIVQAVNDLWDVLPASKNLCWDENETRCCKVVVIGKWLDEGQLKEGFQGCFISSH